MNLEKYVQKLYGSVVASPCPFTKEEIAELEKTNELLIYLPAALSMQELAERFGIKTNVDFDNEQMIRNVMVSEDQWFVTSASKTPELLYTSGQNALRIYENEGLKGMDFRRYLAFAATFKEKFGNFPDDTYWTFLLSGSYDRSGVSVVGFDRHRVLSHHGWMKDFKAKFAGSRYVVLAPRIEITSETQKLKRAYRGSNEVSGRGAATD
ncbi:hypothetical protein A3B21_01515 [Candidatus Uhrbacteria bacterium RIFCSPLOWO2_01_FULL_47_24]|uniref:Uncharacterized protein n=1 Tax=Candidatus Uhrbacteria bacterium RIFCSPLOWO2_01_FULL_47_24 TaxID=1802401 RepID=A0A1F7US35_9BACT|nr:MAG: hypothetical protein A2753_04615 [Candidatus Uhrbacteria bacterium RIFCSPHIGHO2_01_FULL_47_11]OGL68691.1 MAG: hypothetical protein A3D58_02175 [Candidatus Uhrbacteria bacterium RIFCSPHIGHO2_02_FULL_46_47]OGL74965.1 MAG: hypothetical protein A3F52_03145 [Candidatus Uhrbacteria bacterium RIFCSPHIGHO2_12_FULL_47_11]OGL81059.1 MAG: hypothetical protein A3B21_01515 [Candidatus Uhrbacteria bacterium RIFCSPLOWO2_01_FULL_47_24]OGL84578.1 MAG: hypothetical protein A3J03_02110 [Candidatus Uhrbact